MQGSCASAAVSTRCAQCATVTKGPLVGAVMTVTRDLGRGQGLPDDEVDNSQALNAVPKKSRSRM